MFLTFESQKERRAYGGSCFIQLQYCRLPVGTDAEKLVSEGIWPWDLSSLYVWDDDMGEFYLVYKDILQKGLYANLQEGPLDPWGINYYSQEKTQGVMERLQVCRPRGYERLLQWLEENPYHNGFYVLGV